MNFIKNALYYFKASRNMTLRQKINIYAGTIFGTLAPVLLFNITFTQLDTPLRWITAITLFIVPTFYILTYGIGLGFICAIELKQ